MVAEGTELAEIATKLSYSERTCQIHPLRRNEAPTPQKPRPRGLLRNPSGHHLTHRRTAPTPGDPAGPEPTTCAPQALPPSRRTPPRSPHRCPRTSPR
ncbi:hypothetical protein ACRJ4W_07815 [Streptomyces sp. GLT-R25]